MSARARAALPPTVVGLGVVSLLTDAASEMVLPFLALFIESLGGGKKWIGLVEGVADVVASLLRLVAGRISDRSGRRRPFVIGGYALSAIVRPCVALATLPVHVVAVRVLDRVGKGLRGSPRDALIAAAVAPAQRGEAFGFHRAMDHAGAALGSLLALVLAAFVSDDLRTIFWLSAIPGAFAVAAAVVFAREQAVPKSDAHTAEARAEVTGNHGEQRGPRQNGAGEGSGTGGRALAKFLLPLSLFSLGRASDLFLLSLAGAQRASLVELPLLWIGLHLVRSGTATFGGKLADRRGAKTAIALGWLVHVSVFTGLAFASDQNVIRALFLLYGLHAGLSEGAEKAMVARIAPSKRWGAAFGWYHLAAGIFALVASAAFGALWDAQGQTVAFGASAGLAAVAVAWLLCLR